MIAISDAHTGNVVSVLHQLPWDGMEPTGLNIDSAGELWITLSTGPRCSSDINGCGPLPGTCRSEILVANPTTGAVRMVLQGDDNELISDAVPSSDGRRVAFLHSGCADFFFTNDLVVRDVSTGQQTVIGGDLPPCHVLAQPHWSTDSSKVAVVYGPASTAPSPGAGYGSCSTHRGKSTSSSVTCSATAADDHGSNRTRGPRLRHPDRRADRERLRRHRALRFRSVVHRRHGRDGQGYNDNFKRRRQNTPSAPAKTAPLSPSTAPDRDVLVSTCNTATRQEPPSPAPS